MSEAYLCPKETQFAQINGVGLSSMVGFNGAYCAGLFVAWVLNLKEVGSTVDVDFKDFQRWMADNTDRKPFVTATIRRAVDKLLESGAIECIKEFTRTKLKISVLRSKFPKSSGARAATATTHSVPSLPSDPPRHQVRHPQKRRVAKSIADDRNRSLTIEIEGSNADSFVVTNQISSDNRTEEIVFAGQGEIGTQVELSSQENLTSPQCGEVDEQTKESLIREVREVCPLNPTLLQMVLNTIEKYGSKSVRILQGTAQAVQEQIDRGNCDDPGRMLNKALRSALNGRAWTPNRWKKRQSALSIDAEEQTQVSVMPLDQQQQPGSNGSQRECSSLRAITGYSDGTLCYKEHDGWYPAYSLEGKQMELDVTRLPEPSPVPELPEEDREWLAIAARLNLSTGRWDWVESLKEFEIEVRDGIWEPLAVLRRTFSLNELRESLRLQEA